MVNEKVDTGQFNGVDAGIPVLPIHDAFAVEEQNCDWLVEQMKSIWNQNFSCDASIEINRPTMTTK